MIKLKEFFNRALEKIEKNGEVVTYKPVSGGSINEAFYVETKDQQYFVKLNRGKDRSFFEFEATGLKLIEETNTIYVPKVFSVQVDEETSIPMLWMEWVEGKKDGNTDVLLGERLAKLHLTEATHFGFHQDGYIGHLPQKNKWRENWIECVREDRLGGQLEIGRQKGTIQGKREELLLRLLERLDEWIPKQPKPSLLHGDLWGGNWMTGKGGNPYLIDPAVFYGCHEFELAFTELFGGFSRTFYETYNEIYPLSLEYEERKEIYQLYYLLIHLNMFGESYGMSVDRILKKYIGE